MIIFRVQVGLQVQYFEAETADDAIRAAIAADLPKVVLRRGEFFDPLGEKQDATGPWRLLHIMLS